LCVGGVESHENQFDVIPGRPEGESDPCFP
jgi:hypothetical protein